MSMEATLVSRREFFSKTAALTAVAAFPAIAHAANAPIQGGIQLYTVQDSLNKDVAGTLQKLAEIGYKNVETAGFAKLSALEFHKLLVSAGLSAPSAHVMFGFQEPEQLLADANTLGAKLVISSILPPHPIDMSKGFPAVLSALNSLTVDDFKAVAAKANDIARKAQAAGLQYAYHNHNFEFRDLGSSQRGYDILLSETDPATVKFEADCGWMKAAGADPVAFLKAHPDRFVALHAKDFKNLDKPVTTLMISGGPTPTELGRGSIDYRPIISAARETSVKYVFIEQEPPYIEMPAVKAAAVDYKALHTLLGDA